MNKEEASQKYQQAKVFLENGAPDKALPIIKELLHAFPGNTELNSLFQKILASSPPSLRNSKQARSKVWVYGVVFLVFIALGFFIWTLTSRTSDEKDTQVSSVIIEAGNEAGETKTVMLPGDVPLELIWIPAGDFLMGSPENESGRSTNESPQRVVWINKGFWMGKYEVTQAQWESIDLNTLIYDVGKQDWISISNPSVFKGEGNRPVDTVNWADSRSFCTKLTELGLGHFRLPSEAEWEYACRAGTNTRFYWGDDLDYAQIDAYAWYPENSNGTTHPVGLKQPNAWGLYDMIGNVWEWCEDDYYDRYDGAPKDGSVRIMDWVHEIDLSTQTEDNLRYYSVDEVRYDIQKVLRGGSWYNPQHGARSATRLGLYGAPNVIDTGRATDRMGFRVVLEVSAS